MTTPPPPAPADPPAPATTFTQADVDRIAAREKAEGRRAAEAALAELLGMSAADAKTALADYRARLDADKTDAERMRDALAQAQAGVAAARADAAALVHAIAVERALRAAGSQDPELDARLVDAPAGADVAAIAAAVEALKARRPALFTVPAGAPPSDPGAGPRSGTAGDTRSALQRGADRARTAARPGGWTLESGKIVGS